MVRETGERAGGGGGARLASLLFAPSSGGAAAVVIPDTPPGGYNGSSGSSGSPLEPLVLEPLVLEPRGDVVVIDDSPDKVAPGCGGGVRLVRGRDETCPISTGEGRHVSD